MPYFLNFILKLSLNLPRLPVSLVMGPIPIILNACRKFQFPFNYSAILLTSERALLHAGFFRTDSPVTSQKSTLFTTAFVHHTPNLPSLTIHSVLTLSFCSSAAGLSSNPLFASPRRCSPSSSWTVLLALTTRSLTRCCRQTPPFPFVGSAGPN